jgi:hypothetical protein
VCGEPAACTVAKPDLTAMIRPQFARKQKRQQGPPTGVNWRRPILMVHHFAGPNAPIMSKNFERENWQKCQQLGQEFCGSFRARPAHGLAQPYLSWRKTFAACRARAVSARRAPFQNPVVAQCADQLWPEVEIGSQQQVGHAELGQTRDFEAHP